MLKVDKLYIKKGEIILLKGKNGTGKSLFLKSIAQIYGGFSGEIYLNNKTPIEVFLSHICKEELSNLI